MDKDLEDAELRRVRSWDVVPQTEEVRMMAEMAGDLVAELNDAGIPARSIGELANMRLRYVAATPILLRHARRDYPDPVKADIFRALVDARPDPQLFDALVSILEEAQGRIGDRAQVALGCAIASAANREHLGRLIHIVADEKFEIVRLPIVMKIARSKSCEVAGVLRGFFRERSEPTVKEDIISAINALRIARIWDMQDDVRRVADEKDIYRDKDMYALKEAVLLYERAARKAAGLK